MNPKRCPRAFRPRRILAAALACWMVCGGALAQESGGASPAQEKLRVDFLRKVGGKLKEADLYLSGAGKVALAEQRAGTTIPNDEPILLHALIGKSRVDGTQDIYAIKEDSRLLISLTDFVAATNLAIAVKPEQGTAQGWFIRESNGFSLDAGKKQATVAGKVFSIAEKDIVSDGSDILLSSDLLERLFSISFDYDFSSLVIAVATPQPFPIEEAYLRRQKRSNRYSSTDKATLPYQPTRYGLISEPYIDTNINASLTHTPGNESFKTTSWSTIARGDFAGLNARAYLSGTLQSPDYLRRARVTLGKDDPTGELLGPLHATRYRFGDVDTVSNSLIGGGAQELGASITNKSLTSITSRTYTQINGDAQPGWDVELYRNNSYLDARRVNTEGRYDFGNVDLIVGDNDFKLLFFGPQGEVREEHRHVGVDPRSLAGQKGQYEVSLSRKDTTTWEKTPVDAPGHGDPHFSASYEKGVGRLGTVNLAINRNTDESDEERTLAQAGISSFLLGTFLNADIGYDVDSGDTGALLTARRNFGRHSALVQYFTNSEGFNPSSSTAGASLKNSVRTNLSGPVADKLLFLKRINYNIGNSWNTYYNGVSQTGLHTSLATGIGPIQLSGSYVRNERQTDAATTTNGFGVTTGTGGKTTTSSASLSARGSAFGGLWRSSALYSLQPEKELNRAEFEYDRYLRPNLDSTTSISYTPNPKLTTASLGLSWQTRWANINPSVQYDSNQNLTMGVNLHFSAGADPFSHTYNVYNSYLSESGGVAARIFMDKNGDGVFNEGDELLPDIELVAVQGQRSALSDRHGIAFIPDLTKNQLTDITVNPSSSDDPYGTSLFKGISMRAHPGYVVPLEFPIVESGELDGQASEADGGGGTKPARNLKLSLIAPDGRVEKSANAASDGYWAISAITPGAYYLVAEADDALHGFFPPRLIEFKPDGTMLYGQPVLVRNGFPVKYTFSSTNRPPDGHNHARVIVAADIAAQETLLRLGGYHSRIALNFSWYKFRLQNPGWDRVFALATPLGEIKPDAGTQEMKITLRPKRKLSPEQAGLACQDFLKGRFACSVDVVTTYRPMPKIPGAKKPLSEAIASLVGAGDAGRAAPALAAATVPESRLQEALAKTPEAVRAYAAVNPGMDAAALKDTAVIMNLGSYNSRELMALTWYKLKTRYGALVGDTHLLVQPANSYASLENGKHTLLAAAPFGAAEAQRRCGLLNAQGIACTVDPLPAGAQDSALGETDAPPRG